MGPPSFEGGNKVEISASPIGAWSLQWGRLLSKAETNIDIIRHYAIINASMGPPSFEGGNDINNADLIICGNASMGPPSFEGGNLISWISVGAAGAASMGPPSFEGGNQQARMNTQHAVIGLQWGRLLSKAETRIYKSRYAQ